MLLAGVIVMAFTLESPAFSTNGHIPSQYTCEGQDISPPLKWSSTPPGTQSFVLIVDDPDAPDPAAPKMTYVHWVMYNIPATVQSLEEGLGSGENPATGLMGLNDWKRSGYGGPCPPVGEHRYFFKLYALDTLLPKFNSHPTKADLEKAMQGHILGQAQLIGVYRLQKKK